MNIGFEYIKYRWKAKNRHGIHSPFVYTFTDKCMRIPMDPATKSKLEILINKLKHETRTIKIKDFGAGSKKLSNERLISSILATSSSKGKYGLLLYQIAHYYKPKNILEFGTSLGIGTIHMQGGNHQASITTVEACPNTRAEAIKNFSNTHSNEIKSILDTFHDFLSKPNSTIYDVVFVDGHHDGQALLDYMEHLKEISHNETIFILDDIRWSDSMYEAWNKLITDPYYHVTMDLFRMGIVVPRHQQEKEHFTIKI